MRTTHDQPVNTDANREANMAAREYGVRCQLDAGRGLLGAGVTRIVEATLVDEARFVCFHMQVEDGTGTFDDAIKPDQIHTLWLADGRTARVWATHFNAGSGITISGCGVLQDSK